METGIRRRGFVGLSAMAAASLVVDALVDVPDAFAQTTEPVYPGVDLNHINVRVSNCGRSALFYQGLFGGDLRYIHSIPPNPSTPAVESWYVQLGYNFLSLTPVFPQLKLGVDLDHIAPAVSGYRVGDAAASVAKANGFEVVEGTGGGPGWIRDPDKMIYQLSNGDTAKGPFVPPGPPLAQILMKAGERQGTPLVAVTIRDVTLRAADLTKTGGFLAKVFGGEVTSNGSSARRTFKFGRSDVHVMQRTPAMPSDVSLDHLTIATKDFTIESAIRNLQQRGIQAKEDGLGGVVFSDPDGVEVHLV
jgi:hypothetical protein